MPERERQCVQHYTHALQATGSSRQLQAALALPQRPASVKL